MKPPLARNTDPSTSHAAALAAGGLRDIHHAAIIRTLDAAGRPLAAEEVADIVESIDKVQVAKRWSELEEAGVVIKTEDQYLNRSGRRAFRYALKETHVENATD